MSDRAAITERLNTVFRDVFEDDDISVTDATSAHDVDGWDSIAHINLMIAVERAFKIRLAAAEVGGLKNVGQLIDLIAARVA